MTTHARTPSPCKCGAPKLPGQGQRYCAECKELARWRAERKRSTRVVRKRDPCADCGGIKPPGHGRRVCDKCSAQRRAAKAARRRAKRHYCCRMCGVETGIPWATCRICHLRSRYRRKQRMKAYRASWDRKHRGRQNRAKREARKMDYRLKRERDGKPVTRRPPNGYAPGRYNGAYAQISAEPLLPHLSHRLSDTSSTALGEVANVDPYKIECIVQSKTATIALASADRLCVALGVPFVELYGGVEI